MVVIEDHVNTVKAVRRSHRTGASQAKGSCGSDTRIFLCREALLADPTTLTTPSTDPYSVDPGSDNMVDPAWTVLTPAAVIKAVDGAGLTYDRARGTG
ncbi:MAG: hypothetical protein ACRD0C_23785, partial [Acidimicrobiia bacterium]